jgi:hypothetical protein
MQSDWWLEEHGLIMEKPTFPLPAGKYMVTGDREVTTELTITEDNKWSLKQGAQLPRESSQPNWHAGWFPPFISACRHIT